MKWIALLLLPTMVRAADTTPSVAVGRKIFESQCALCHGQNGGGGRGPNLNRPNSSKLPMTKLCAVSFPTGFRPRCPAPGS